MLKQMLPSILFRVQKLLKPGSSDLLKLAAILLSIGFVSVSGYSQSYPCLPPDVTEDVVVRVVRYPVVKKFTVNQTLKDLKAKCSKGRLIDGKKKEIKFYNLVGCWGNPPEDYLEIQQRQRNELAELKRRYTVVEITCNTGDPLRRIPSVRNFLI